MVKENAYFPTLIPHHSFKPKYNPNDPVRAILPTAFFPFQGKKLPEPNGIQFKVKYLRVLTDKKIDGSNHVSRNNSIF